MGLSGSWAPSLAREPQGSPLSVTILSSQEGAGPRVTPAALGF